MSGRTRKAPTHYMRVNERDWSPSHVCFFDTETAVVPGTEPELSKLVLWCARSVLRRQVKGATERTADGWGRTGDELVTWLETVTKSTPSTWVYAHNLAYDLATTNLVLRLIRGGWVLGDFSFNDRSPFFRFKKASRRLLLTDSYSWLPDSLAAIGKSLGKRKPPLPDDAGDTRRLLRRCRGDVDILASAICGLMDWWDQEKLGNWSITGASCGWSAMRHKMAAKSFLVRTDQEGIEHDRLAIRGGRRDAWRIGVFRNGPYVEIDFEAAHPTLAAHLPMPARRGRLRGPGELDSTHILSDNWGLIARCTVSTPVPRYPVTIQGQVWYPTGTFTTVLAGPELQMAERRGELVNILDGRVHFLGHGLQRWANWCLAVQRGDQPNTPPVAQIAAKSWGRSVIGKFAGRTNHVVAERESWNQGYDAIRGWDVQRNCKTTWVTIAGREWQVAQDQWSEHAYPAVLAWIESHLRVRMATVIEALPPQCLITCNTDGLIIDEGQFRIAMAPHMKDTTRRSSSRRAVEQWCERISEKTWPLRLRVKAVHREAVVLGPAAMELDQRRRWSGVRHDAKRFNELPDAERRAIIANGKDTDMLNGEHVFVARLWPKIAWQLSQNSQEGYLRPLRVVASPGPHVHRWICADGSLRPPQARTGPDGQAELVPWAEADAFARGMIPAAHQHPILARML